MSVADVALWRPRWFTPLKIRQSKLAGPPDPALAIRNRMRPEYGCRVSQYGGPKSLCHWRSRNKETIRQYLLHSTV